VQSVVSYLQQTGFTNVQATSNNLFVTGNATAAQADTAFNTTLQSWSVKGNTLYANSTAAQVPSNLGDTVLSVLGLNNAAVMHGGTQPSDTVPNYLESYTPEGFWKAYDAGSTPTGSKTAVAIFGSGDMTSVVQDLRTEEAADKLPQVPETTVYSGIVSPQVGDDPDEWDMDTQFSTGMAGGVSKLYIYSSTTLTDSDLALSFNHFASDDLAKAGSASFGECEYQAYLDGAMVAWDQIFAEAAAQGQTVFASAGDTGGFCPVAPNNGVPAGVPDTNYPSSSPYVVSVGGTSLFTNSDGSYNNEIAWVAGGGGPSIFEYQPFWQNGIAPPTSETCVEVVACLGKTTPDIAMDADPESGANVYISGQPEGVGGTSLASPLALGVWARLESAHKNAIGFAAPALYGKNGSAGFHDITVGDTGPYPATPGYDLATGLGTFDVSAMNGLFTSTSSGSGSGTTPTLASPACTAFTDPSGDSAPPASTDSGASLDILAGGFSTNGSTLSASLLVRNLLGGPGGTPGIAGDGNVWYITWTFKGTEYFLSAEEPGTTVNTSDPTALPVDYSYGTVGKLATGGTQFNSGGSATGTLDTATNTITITAPLADLGGPASGASLTATGALTYASVGTPAGGLLESADGAGPGSSYTIGKSC
jgi:subtilase family serine protease